jgi:hypothetical protein
LKSMQSARQEVTYLLYARIHLVDGLCRMKRCLKLLREFQPPHIYMREVIDDRLKFSTQLSNYKYI